MAFIAAHVFSGFRGEGFVLSRRLVWSCRYACAGIQWEPKANAVSQLEALFLFLYFASFMEYRRIQWVACEHLHFSKIIESCPLALKRVSSSGQFFRSTPAGVR